MFTPVLKIFVILPKFSFCQIFNILRYVKLIPNILYIDISLYINIFQYFISPQERNQIKVVHYNFNFSDQFLKKVQGRLFIYFIVGILVP